MTLRHTHGHTRRANNDRYGAEGIEDGGRLAPVGNKPIVCLEGQGEAEQILEDDHASEALDGEVTC